MTDPYFTVPRAALQVAIETGIEYADAQTYFTEAARESLRRVGRESKLVAVGGFRVGGCGCPATQAGLWPAGAPYDALVAFVGTFDRAMTDWLGNDATIPVVVFEVED